MAMLWILNQADGSNSLLEIAGKSGLRYSLIRETSDILLEHELLRT